MRVNPRRRALLLSILAIVILLSVYIHYHRQAVYTASLATRPFTIGLIGKLDSLEPGSVDQHEEKLLASTMYEGLVRYDEKSGKVKPLLARKWKYSSDKKSITFTLDTNIRFSNGKKLSANDVKASWEANFAKGQDWSNLANLFLPVAGGFDRIEGRTDNISGIQVINNHTLKVKLERPNAAFLCMLTNPVFWVYDIQVTEESTPGTGPFVLKENQENKHFTLTRNEKYHGELPRLCALDVQVYDDPAKALADYKQGKLDYLDQVPLEEVKNIKKDPVLKNRFIGRPLFYTYGLGFNISKKPYDNNYLLRRALNYAVDRKEIADNIMGGVYRPVKGVLPAGIPGFDSHMRGYSFDREKARQLLEEAGYPEGEDLAQLIISYDQSEGNQVVMEAVANQLEKIGIRVLLQPMDWDYYKKQMGSMELSCFRLGWQADYPDADSFLYNMFHSSRMGISNYYAYNNPQLDKVLDASRARSLDSEERMKLINRAENIVVDDAPCLFLFQKMAAKLVGEGVKNLTVDGMEMIDWTKIELFKPSMDSAKKA